MSKRGSTPASRPTPFTVQAMRPRAAPSVLLQTDGYAGAASGEPATHGNGLTDSRCSAAHTSSAANDGTSSSRSSALDRLEAGGFHAEDLEPSPRRGLLVEWGDGQQARQVQDQSTCAPWEAPVST